MRALLLTHIHLDHAGATGVLVRENPELKVYVHERGAPHLVDPSRLLASATRLYGDRMEMLWGEVTAVPAANVVALTGGERIDVVGRPFDVAYTPGHAVHHVSYLDPATGTAYVGDTAGIRVNSLPFALPPAPPPDIDLEAWKESLARIRAWAPERLFVTHFGPLDDVSGTWRSSRRGSSRGPMRCGIARRARTDEERARRFVEAARADAPPPAGGGGAGIRRERRRRGDVVRPRAVLARRRPPVRSRLGQQLDVVQIVAEPAAAMVASARAARNAGVGRTLAADRRAAISPMRASRRGRQRRSTRSTGR